MFANSRIPGRYCDHWKPNRYARHLAVYANGCFYKMDLFEEKTNRLYTPEEIAEYVRYIAACFYWVALICVEQHILLPRLKQILRNFNNIWNFNEEILKKF